MRFEMKDCKFEITDDGRIIKINVDRKKFKNFTINSNIYYGPPGQSCSSGNTFNPPVLIALPPTPLTQARTFLLSNNDYYLKKTSLFPNPNSGEFTLQLSADPSWYGMIADWVTVTGTGCPTQLTCELFRDDVPKFNPNVAQYFNGTYVFIYNTTGNNNYSMQSVTDTLYINYTAPTSTCVDVRFAFDNYNRVNQAYNCGTVVNFKYFNDKLQLLKIW
jgi:hypothetical protein